MSIAANLVTLGVPAKWSDYLGAVSGAIVATGTTQGAAQAITPYTTVFVSVTATDKAIILPALPSVKYAPIIIFNIIDVIGRTLDVFPASGEQIFGAGGADLPQNVAEYAMKMFWPVFLQSDTANSGWLVY